MNNEMMTLEAAVQRIAELEERLAEVVRENDRLGEARAAANDAAAKARKSVAELKDVARFYRAQRDRIDGYLSGVLDTHREVRRPPGPNIADVEAKVSELAQSLRFVGFDQRASRPLVSEPTLQHARQDFAAYRDQEPRGWEDL